MKQYYLPCVKCPFCGEIVEAEVTEEKGMKKLTCPACRKFAEYKIKPKSPK